MSPDAAEHQDCGLAFAQVVAVTAYESVRLREKVLDKDTWKDFETVFVSWLSKSVDKVAEEYGQIPDKFFPTKPAWTKQNLKCFPVRDTLSGLDRLSKTAAQLIADSVRWIAIGRDPAKGSETFSKYLLFRMDEAIALILKFGLYRRDHISGPYLASKRLEGIPGELGGICSRHTLNEQFLTTVYTLPDIPVDHDYAPVLFEYFKHIHGCSGREGTLLGEMQLLDGPEDASLFGNSPSDLSSRGTSAVTSEDPFKCSLAFAQVVAITADVLHKQISGDIIQIDSIIEQQLAANEASITTAYNDIAESFFLPDFEKPVLESGHTCFPLNSHVAGIRGLSQPAARLIAAAVRWVGIGGDRGGSLKRDEFRLLAMTDFITSIRANLASSEDLIRGFTEPSPHSVGCPPDIWSNHALADQFRNSIQLMNEQVEGNYFPSLNKLQEQMIACADEVAISSVGSSARIFLGKGSAPPPPPPPSVPSSRDPLRPTVADETFRLSSMATEEDLFFTNFHNAAQQLSLLGIKAVGLATQIQAIRGHLMMLQLIDQHIITLEKDRTTYSALLANAHVELKKVTGVVKADEGHGPEEGGG